MIYRQHINACFSDTIGEYGISDADFKAQKPAILAAISTVKKARDTGKLPLITLPYDKQDTAHINEIATDLRKRFSTLVVIGMGGSILNPRTTCTLAKATEGKKIIFVDSVDPLIFEAQIAELNIKDTAFLAISKSGNTLETISQLLLCLEQSHKALGSETGKHWFMLTDPHKNPLRDLAAEIGATILDHPAGIGGRYSGLSAVGLLPAAFAGLDITAMRNGATKLIDDLFEQQENSLAAQGAALTFAFLQKNISLSVILPYISRLIPFTTWYSQIVAESLGKDGKGITPIRAVGPMDQHSQLQLFLDGPKDKLTTFISQSQHSASQAISNTYLATKSFDYLNGKTLADVLRAEQQATIETLEENQCPLRHIEIEQLNEHVLGGLMMQMMLEVILLGHLMELNPFDQPAVEQGKIRTRELLRKNAKD